MGEVLAAADTNDPNMKTGIYTMYRLNLLREGGTAASPGCHLPVSTRPDTSVSLFARQEGEGEGEGEVAVIPLCLA